MEDNLKHLQENFKNYLETFEHLQNEKEMLSYLHFDIQKQKQIKVINNLKNKLAAYEEELNKGISPYKWNCVKNVDERDYVTGIHIKANYGLFLV